MLVSKTINNNIVICQNDSGREVIAMGRGLGFQCRPGTEVNPALVEKLFQLEDAQADKFKKMLSSLPAEHIQLCAQIIDHAAETLQLRLNENVYLTLTDHISFVIQRLSEGISVSNALLYEVRTFYPQEYAIGCYALALIRRDLGVELPQDEAASIALHLINAEYDRSFNQTLQSAHVLHDILNLLHGWPDLDLSDENPYFNELAVQLKFLAQRVFSGISNSRDDLIFVNTVARSYPADYECAQQITRHLSRACGHPVSQEDIAYLALHIRRIHRTPN